MKEYLIKKIEPELMRNFKTGCAYFEVTMRDTIILHMECIAEKYLRAQAMSGRKEIYEKKGGKKK